MRKILLSGLFLCLVSVGYCQICTPSSYLSGAAFSNLSGGTVSWSNEANAASNNNSFASVGATVAALATVYTDQLTVSGFSPGVPSGATICGIEVRIRKKTDGVIVLGNIRDHSVRLMKAGAVVGSNLGNTSTNWGSTEAAAVHGGSAETWGTTWTPSEVNDPGFGVAISLRMYATVGLFMAAEIDQVEVNVHYNMILPWVQTTLQAEHRNGTVRLSWKTGNANGQKAVVQKMTGTGWKGIDSLYVLGTPGVESAYALSDKNPGAVNRYRLLTVEHSGRSTYSHETVFRLEQVSASALDCFAGEGFAQIETGAQVKEVKIFDMAGRSYPVREKTYLQNVLRISTREMMPGMYVVSVSTNAGQRVGKLMIR